MHRRELGVDGAVADDALVVQPAALVVLGALLNRHHQVVGQRAGPQRGGHVHVPGQRGGAAIAAELGRGEAIGAVAGAEAAVSLGDADGEQALGMHVAEVLDRKGGVAIVLGSARRQHALAEPAGSFDQLGFVAVEAERGRVEYRRVGVVRVGSLGIHGRNRASSGSRARRHRRPQGPPGWADGQRSGRHT